VFLHSLLQNVAVEIQQKKETIKFSHLIKMFEMTIQMVLKTVTE